MTREDIAWTLSQIAGDFPLLLSERDQFACAALTGLLPKIPLVDQKGEYAQKVEDKKAWNLDIARSAYAFADAMIEARLEKR